MGKIYLDTNLYIYYFENNPEFSKKVEYILTESVSSNIQVIASPLVFTELLAGPIRDKNSKLVKIYSQLPNILTNIIISDFDLSTSITTAHLRATYHLPIPDCIHLATALQSECDQYCTSDKNLKQVKEIKVALV